MPCNTFIMRSIARSRAHSTPQNIDLIFYPLTGSEWGMHWLLRYLNTLKHNKLRIPSCYIPDVIFFFSSITEHLQIFLQNSNSPLLMPTVFCKSANIQRFPQHLLNFSVLFTTISFSSNKRRFGINTKNNSECVFTWHYGANVRTEVDSRRFRIYNVLCKHERSLPLAILWILRHIIFFNDSHRPVRYGAEFSE